MPKALPIEQWPKFVRKRYENYLKTSFFFKDPKLRASFEAALQKSDSLLKGPFPEPARSFKKGQSARALAGECFPGESGDLLPALLGHPLYLHQERALIQKVDTKVPSLCAAILGRLFLQMIMTRTLATALSNQ